MFVRFYYFRREEEYLQMVLSKQKELSQLQRQQLQARLDEIKELNRQLVKFFVSTRLIFLG